MYRGDAVFFVRLRKVLRRQDALIGFLQRQQFGAQQRRELARLRRELQTLQQAMWTSLAARPRARLLAAARQVDALAERWSVVASELQSPSRAT